MCLRAIFQFLYNLLWGSPIPEPPHRIEQESEYSPESSPEPDKYDSIPIEERILGSSLHPLRFRAHLEREQMVKSFKRSRDNLQSQNDKAAAKKSAMVHKRSMESLNKRASEQIFSENNKRVRPGMIDLHGLYVDEAIIYTDRVIQEATDRGETELRLIDKGGTPLEFETEDQNRRHIVTTPDPKNPGILIVQVAPEQRGESSLINPKL
ncbi:hypothetical protein BDZ94DRAFT_1311067 [Collybia nuda]|uniref:Smr domain-containing protein n=1 Tax=Collybia nuda TaxID=64659 RepID=A0A9P6CCS0_9AGAR|nr:hypothetical protein BDZ94DRAFT_1311067 [Collybia nuda]